MDSDQPFGASSRAVSGLTPCLIEDKELYRLLDSCRRRNRNSQDRLYRVYYGYAMGVCLRYARSYEEAVEIVNDGFVKIFSKIEHYSKGLSFKGWLRRIMINSAIDHYRRNEKHYNTLDISYVQYEPETFDILDQLSAEEIIEAIQQLPPSYRMVFNLHAIEGFKHEEIAVMMNISAGTSKSNLSIARSKLKRILLGRQVERYTIKENG